MRRTVIITALSVVFLASGLTACAGSKRASKPAEPTQPQIQAQAKAEALARTALRKRLAQQARVAARKARVAARARAKAAAAARARAKKEAAAHAAYVAAANAWHRGYSQYDANTYYRWRHGISCTYADYCWHIEVITRYGCSSLFVEANELSGSTNVGDLIDSRNNLTAKTPALLELVSTSGSTSTVASAPTIKCNE
jgi:hypothetical protein